jgi:hypothetical protein
MQHEMLAELALQRVDDLLVLAGAEGGDTERLGLAAGEQSGAVGARQDADLGDDGADGLGVPPVDAQAGIEDGVADDVGLQVLEQAFGGGGIDAVLGQRGGGGLLGGADLVVAGGLGALLIGVGERGAGQRIDAGGQGFLLLGGFGQRPGLLGGVFGERTISTPSAVPATTRSSFVSFI